MTKLKDKQSVDKIVSEMTLEEKISALTGSSIVFGQPQEKYGIPPVYFLDGGTGANYLQMYMDCFLKNMDLPDKSADKIFGADSPLQEMPYLMSIQYDREATEKADEKSRKKLAVMAEKMKEYIPGNVLPGCFPPGILLGATWNRETVSEVGEALGNEALYYHIDVLLGTPNVNIHRDPLGGRLFEGYSEDPHLVSELAPEFVKGVQKTGVIANVKHFAANNQETDRRSVDEHIPIRALYEIYFPGFKACVHLTVPAQWAPNTHSFLRRTW